MKQIKYIFLVGILLGFVACDEDWMNPHNEGATIDGETKAEASELNDAAASAGIDAMYAQMIAYEQGVYWTSSHGDFGYAAVCLQLEQAGQDFTGITSGYNKYTNAANYPVGRGYNYFSTYLHWGTLYKVILNANNVLEEMSLEDQEKPENWNSNMCQAYCVRALCYLQLAQMYQFTYVGNEDKPCVPIVSDHMPVEKTANNPRASVKETYEFIMKDLDRACNSKLFASFKGSSKGYATQAVAYGLRARANLIMQKYDEASADAQKCLDLSGATCLSIAEAGVPGFADAAEHNVIWANIVSTTNDIVQSGIVNWPSMLSMWYISGYTGVGSLHCICSYVYDQIPATDVRKGWWLDENHQSPLLTSSKAYTSSGDYQVFLGIIAAHDYGHANVKFGTKGFDMSSDMAASSDWIIMRAEEMELIKAECAAHNGDASVLTAFVQTYRDPSYTLMGDPVEAVLFQRRVELWGEGFALEDLLRFNRGLTDRSRSSNWPDQWKTDVPLKNLLFLIPQDEIEANAGISMDQNNDNPPID